MLTPQLHHSDSAKKGRQDVSTDPAPSVDSSCDMLGSFEDQTSFDDSVFLHGLGAFDENHETDLSMDENETDPVEAPPPKAGPVEAPPPKAGPEATAKTPTVLVLVTPEKKLTTKRCDLPAALSQREVKSSISTPATAPSATGSPESVENRINSKSSASFIHFDKHEHRHLYLPEENHSTGTFVPPPEKHLHYDLHNAPFPCLPRSTSNAEHNVTDHIEPHVKQNVASPMAPARFSPNKPYGKYDKLISLIKILLLIS